MNVGFQVDRDPASKSVEEWSDISGRLLSSAMQSVEMVSTAVPSVSSGEPSKWMCAPMGLAYDGVWGDARCATPHVFDRASCQLAIGAHSWVSQYLLPQAADQNRYRVTLSAVQSVGTSGTS